MSQFNLLDVGLKDMDDGDDEKGRPRPGPGPAPQPRPRPRAIGAPSSGGAGGGVPNEGFSMDEYVVGRSGDHDHDFKATSPGGGGGGGRQLGQQQPRRQHGRGEGDGDTYPSRLLSSPAKAKKGKLAKGDPFSVAVAATAAVGTPVKDGGAGDDVTTVTIESEVQRKPKPRPRPRPRTDHQALVQEKVTAPPAPKPKKKTAHTQPSRSFSRDDSEIGSSDSLEPSRPKEASGKDKDEYLIVPIPDETEAQDVNGNRDEGAGGVTKNSAGRLFGKWKQAIKSFSKEAIIAKQGSIRLRGGGGGRRKRSDRDGEPEPEPDVEAGGDRRDPNSETEGSQEDEEVPRRGRARKQSSAKSAKSAKSERQREHDLDLDHQRHLEKDNRSHHRRRPGSKSSKSSMSTSELLGITIHKSDPLPPDPLCTHPVVKVTLMTQEGAFIPASASRGRISSGDGTGRRRSVSGGPGLTNEMILPMLTQPFQLSTSKYSVPAREPAWNELVLFDEPFWRFVQDESAIFFFEVMDFLPIDHVDKLPPRNRYPGSERGWHKFAWGFLKPVGANGVKNVNRKLRLQLYKPERLTTGWGREAATAREGPEVYWWWKLRRMTKLESTTLHITVKSIAPPAFPTPSLQTLLTMKKEELTEALIDSQLQRDEEDSDDGGNRTPVKKRGTLRRREYVPPVWSRLQGQSCKPPNKLIASLPSSDLDSLKIRVSGNVHCVKFSPCGEFLAAGLDTDQLHTVLIFQIPSANLLRSLRCHHGLIYDLDWSHVSTGYQGQSRDSQNCLAIASGDSTTSIWRFRDDPHGGQTVNLIKVLLHPSFVYCTRFHPQDPNLMATGCFDRIVRIWKVGGSSSRSKEPDIGPHDNLKDSCPLLMLDGHSSFVNCLAFHPTAKFLFTGDGEGSLYQWKSSAGIWTLHRSVRLLENHRRPINSISIHPAGNKLLVQSRDSVLKIVDVDTFLVLQSFHGFMNESYRLGGAVFSPCGNLVLCGSEDGSLCVWDADTARILQFLRPEGTGGADLGSCMVTSVGYHPHDYYVTIGLSATATSTSTSGVSCPVLLYTYEPPPKIQLSSLVKLKQIANGAKGRARQQGQRQHLRYKNAEAEEDTCAEEVRANSRASQRLREEIVSPAPRSTSTQPQPQPQESVDSTDRFLSILAKLDTVLKVTNIRDTGTGALHRQEPEALTSELPKTPAEVQADAIAESPKPAKTSNDRGKEGEEFQPKSHRSQHRNRRVVHKRAPGNEHRNGGDKSDPNEEQGINSGAENSKLEHHEDAYLDPGSGSEDGRKLRSHMEQNQRMHVID